MSLGLGIFLSVLVLIVAWQVDKRGAWGKLWKVSLWLVGLILIGGGILFAWTSWEDGKYEREQQALIERVRKADIADHWDIKLGMSENEVLYLKGNPEERKMNKDGLPFWKLNDGGATVHVYWDANGRVRALTCQNSAVCPQFLDVGIDSTEAEIVEKLGPPPKPDVPNEHGVKAIEYGSKPYFLTFLMTKGRAVVVMYGKRNQSDSKKEAES